MKIPFSLISTSIRYYSSMLCEFDGYKTSHKYFNLYDLPTRESEHLFMCLDLLFCGLYIDIFGHFYVGLFIFFVSICKLFLYSLQINPLSFVLQILIHISCQLTLFLLPLPYKSCYILNSKYLYICFYNFWTCKRSFHGYKVFPRTIIRSFQGL